MPPKTQKLIDELKAWCDQEPRYGRRTSVAKAIGTSLQTITNWFGGWAQPTSEQILDVQDFLKKHRQRR